MPVVSLYDIKVDFPTVSVMYVTDRASQLGYNS